MKNGEMPTVCGGVMCTSSRRLPPNGFAILLRRISQLRALAKHSSRLQKSLRRRQQLLLEGAERVLDALGIPPWRRTVGDEPAKALAIPSQDLVKRVDERRQAERAKDASERSGELDLGKEQEASTSVARDWRSIGEY
jgi:hypothetical protein